MSEKIDLFRYHDLTKRLAAFAVAGGDHLRGETDDVRVVDADIALGSDEQERARFAGVISLLGPRSIPRKTDEPTFGLVLEGAGAVIATSHRLVVMAKHGVSQLGPITDDEVHTFAFPWDLVDSISMPARKSVTDWIAGSRTIDVFSAMFLSLRLNPANRALIGGRDQPVSDEEVLRFLTRTAARHRLAVSPSSEHARLQPLLESRLRTSDGDFIAYVTAEDNVDIPPHLVGRVVERGAVGIESVRASDHARRRENAALLLLNDG